MCRSSNGGNQAQCTTEETDNSRHDDEVVPGMYEKIPGDDDDDFFDVSNIDEGSN